MIELFQRSPWQMTAGERAALDGLLRNLAPRLSIEIGTAEGGSLRCIAERSQAGEEPFVKRNNILVADHGGIHREQKHLVPIESRVKVSEVS